MASIFLVCWAGTASTHTDCLTATAYSKHVGPFRYGTTLQYRRMALKLHNNDTTHHADQQNSVKSEVADTDDESSTRSPLSEKDAEKHHDHVEEMPAEEDNFSNLMRMSRDLAHNLNNLLTTRLANTQLTSLIVKDEEVKPYLNAVEEATGEAGEAVRKFQESIRMLAGGCM